MKSDLATYLKLQKSLINVSEQAKSARGERMKTGQL